MRTVSVGSIWRRVHPSGYRGMIWRRRLRWAGAALAWLVWLVSCAVLALAVLSHRLPAQTARDTTIAAIVRTVHDSLPCTQWWVAARQVRACTRLDSTRTGLLTVGRVTDFAASVPLQVARDSVLCYRPPWLTRIKRACVRLDSLVTALETDATVATVSGPVAAILTHAVWPNGLFQLDSATATGDLVCVLVTTTWDGTRYAGYPAVRVRRAPLRSDSVIVSPLPDTGAVLKATCQSTLGGTLAATHWPVVWSRILTPVISGGSAVWLPVARAGFP